MTREERAPIIVLPFEAILTEEGEYFFNRHNDSLKYLRGPHPKDSSQISPASYSAKLLQRLIVAGYISQIEVTRTNFNSKRGELMDLAKLVSYGLLRRSYNTKLVVLLNQSSMVSHWNRKNPSKAINKSAILPPPHVNQPLRDNETLQAVMRAVIDEIFSYYDHELNDLPMEERRMLQYKAEDFLSQVNPLIWALTVSEGNRFGVAGTAGDLRETVWEYLQKTNIADYLSLLILELASLAEKSLMQMAVSTYLKGKVDLDYFIKNRAGRTKVLESLQAHNDTASLIWKLQGRSAAVNDSQPFHFVVANRTSEAESALEDLEGKKHITTRGKSLIEFYEEQKGGDQELGLFYLSYLQEECRKQGTMFNSYASQLSQQALSLMTLSVRF